MNHLRLITPWALVGVALTPPAWAQIDIEAEHRRGLALRDAGRPAEAAAVFRTLYESTREPRALVRLTLAEAAAFVEAHDRSPLEAFRWLPTEEHLREALTLSADPYVRTPAVQNALRQTQTVLQQRLSYLEISAEPADAEVWAATTRVTTLPLQRALRVPAGRYSLLVRAPGFAPRSVPVEARPGIIATAQVTLEAESSPVTPPHAVTAPAAEAVPPRTPNDPARSTSATAAPRILAWTLLGVGIAVGAVGVVQWIRSADNLQSLQQAAPTDPDPYGAWVRFNTEVNAQARFDAAEVCRRAEAYASGPARADALAVADLCAASATTDALALGLGLGGAALTLGGAVLLTLSPRARPTLHSRLPRPQLWQPGAGRQGLSLAWSF